MEPTTYDYKYIESHKKNSHVVLVLAYSCNKISLLVVQCPPSPIPTPLNCFNFIVVLYSYIYIYTHIT